MVRMLELHIIIYFSKFSESSVMFLNVTYVIDEHVSYDKAG